MFSTISRLPALLFCIYTKLLLKRKKVQCPLYYRRKPSLNFSVTMITFLCEEKSHGFKMRVWIIVHSKLAKNNYFFDVWCRNVQMISRTKTSPPNSIKKMCSRKFEKGMEEEENNFCTFNCLFKWYDECSHRTQITGNGLCFHEKKEKRNKNPSR